MSERVTTQRSAPRVAHGKRPDASRSQAATVVCFGELLWDSLPRGLCLGGAPVNAAYHLSRHGIAALAVSAVGRDFLGDEALRRLSQSGLDAAYVARHVRWSTGTVQATLDEKGIATYKIAERVAWDHIVIPNSLRRKSPTAVVYGTLALRGSGNRRALSALLNCWPDALRVVDLNLRAPFDRPAVIAFALKHAQIVKLNDDELSRLVGLTKRTPEALAKAAHRFAEQHGIGRVCVTAGARGAGLWWEGRWLWEDARRITLCDTVGAGDAFLGAFLAALLLRRAAPADALRQACRMGEFVASREGATPPYQLTPDGAAADL